MEKIKKLKQIIKLHNLDGYIVPKNDEFFSEFVESEKDDLKFISNFSGSYGFAIILTNSNYLLVDGRYTLQAKLESKNFKIIDMYKKTYFKIFKNKKLKIGYCPKLFTSLTLKRIFSKTSLNTIPIEENFIDKIRPKKISKKPKKIFSLSDKVAGQSPKKKIEILIKNLKKKKLDFMFISAPENVAWLLNLRGFDSLYSPQVNCHAILSQSGEISLFIDRRKVERAIRKKLNFVKIIDIKYLSSFLGILNKINISVDVASCSQFYLDILKKNNNIFYKKDLIYLLKAKKNKTEINNMKKAHIEDGLALTRFIFWIKENFNKKKITEISAQEKIYKLRKKNKNFKFLSFPTISSTGSNGAIIHYRASKKTNQVLKKGKLYLIDSGGQYFYGTTDVTRTLSLQNNNKRIKDIYTRVLKGHIAVANYRINKKTTGSEIDRCARRYLNAFNLDYNHGTGHGVGYFYNVHEGPLSISKFSNGNFEKGMVLSNEPGYYEKNKFGIRIENLVAVNENSKNLFFENLTMVPIDKDLINKRLLSKNEIKWLDNYHRNVFLNLKKFMKKQERKKLKIYCSKI